MRITRGPALVIGGLAVIVAVAACGSAGSSNSVQYLPTATLPTVTQVAAEMHATGVSDCTSTGAGSAVGVIDAGNAYWHGERIGINVWPTLALRDAWEKLARNLGYPVIAQGTSWAAYRAPNQAGTGCD